MTYERIVAVLTALGYTIQNGDQALITFLMGKTDEYIKNQCNLQEVPEGLTNCWVSLVIADFLTAKMAVGSLAGFANLNFEGMLSELKEGDTDIRWNTYAEQTPEARFKAFVKLLRSSSDQFVTYRKIKW